MMASKSKQKRMKQLSKSKPATLAVFIAVITATLAYFQNKYGQFSDIRGFYGMHFSDGLHHWPFSAHTLLGAKDPSHPVEYPALTGLIMWLISFLVKPTQFAFVDYFRITAMLHVALFAVTVYLIKRLSNNKWAIYFALSPAVLYSLNRNWDIWAVVTMMWAIYLFEKGKEKSSAILLSISIATKFFPLVLLLPIAIWYLRNKEISKFLKYLGITIGGWLVINLPFAVVNFRGWSYFYEFSYKRGLGSASLFDIAGKLGFPIPFANIAFYLLNLLIFGIVVSYFLLSKSVVPISEAAFFTMFAFILFNKQYSMQYIIWLTALAVIALSKLEKKYQLLALISYLAWQIFDLLFQYVFFQNILTNTYENTNTTEPYRVITNSQYGLIGGIRYLLAMAFFTILGIFLYRQKSPSSIHK